MDHLPLRRERRDRLAQMQIPLTAQHVQPDFLQNGIVVAVVVVETDNGLRLAVAGWKPIDPAAPAINMD